MYEAVSTVKYYTHHGTSTALYDVRAIAESLIKEKVFIKQSSWSHHCKTASNPIKQAVDLFGCGFTTICGGKLIADYKAWARHGLPKAEEEAVEVVAEIDDVEDNWRLFPTHKVSEISLCNPGLTNRAIWYLESTVLLQVRCFNWFRNVFDSSVFSFGKLFNI